MKTGIYIIVVISLINKQYYAANNSKNNLKNLHIIQLTKGLLTKIPIILLKEKTNWTTQEIIVQNSKYASLAEIIATQHVIFHSRTIAYSDWMVCFMHPLLK